MKTKISKYQYRWVGFQIVRGNGTVGPILKRLGFFRGGERMGFKYVKPVGTDAGSTLARMRERGIKGVARVFTDANWSSEKLTSKQMATNYAD